MPLLQEAMLEDRFFGSAFEREQIIACYQAYAEHGEYRFCCQEMIRSVLGASSICLLGHYWCTLDVVIASVYFLYAYWISWDRDRKLLSSYFSIELRVFHQKTGEKQSQRERKRQLPQHKPEWPGGDMTAKNRVRFQIFEVLVNLVPLILVCESTLFEAREHG
ncbi:uncharacterized protein EDB93DRAFT_1302083 [Suillus bovinus]|uniref:uncharacterized protein n=1 Tax=Suillus bovinus TaxID=48563 RepID=UPI001B86189C|nr:uncharacterized protein EDB93DRAFT_1302083 [Suillus bovinus]KAG2137592.1 hypothetical protein EDB93DRAFT_1302083 [Suillus bovinus]